MSQFPLLRPHRLSRFHEEIVLQNSGFQNLVYSWPLVNAMENLLQNSALRQAGFQPLAGTVVTSWVSPAAVVPHVPQIQNWGSGWRMLLLIFLVQSPVGLIGKRTCAFNWDDPWG